MKRNNAFLFLIFVLLGGIFSASCRSQEAPNDVNEFEAPEPLDAASGFFLSEEIPFEEGDDLYIQAFMVTGTAEWPDIILAAYRDPEFKEEVTAFFGELTGSNDVARVVLANSSALDISPALAFALCWEESRYNPVAYNVNRNETRDRGLFQLNSATFPALKVEDFYDLEINARHGLSHLRWCLNNAGTEVAGLAMYNAGTTRVRSAGTPKNTLDYISRILKQQRKIEGLFLAKYTRMVHANSGEEEQKPPFRLSLLTPLGR